MALDWAQGWRGAFPNSEDGIRNSEEGIGQRAEGIGDFGLRILDFVMSEGQRDSGLRPRETGFAFHGAGILDLGKANLKVLKTE